MGKKAKAPAAPDPLATASSQGAANRDTAIAQNVMNMTNQRTADGSLTYNKLSDETYTDSLTGKTYTVPRYEAVQSYSPEAQARINQQNEFDSKTNQLAIDQTDRLKGILSQPVDLSNEATEKRLFDLASRRLTPRFAEDDEALRTRLANQGIRAGSVAYDSEMRRFGENKNDALNQLLLQGRGQATQEALTERNQPINEITALMSGGQVSQPNFVNTPQTSLAAPDFQGATYNSYNGQMQGWKAKNDAQMGLVNGLFQTIGAAGSAAMKASDIRLKDNIVKIGQLNNGLNWYKFTYKGDPEKTVHFGVMAQEVELVKPHAVHMFDGYRVVDMIAATEPNNV